MEQIAELEVETEVQVEPEMEEEVKPKVEYSQVNLSKRTQRIEPTGVECIYAKVHKIR